LGSTGRHPQQALIDDLKILGFTEYEARVYMALLHGPPATAYEISKVSGVPRPNTYTALNGLAARNAAMPVSERPVRYVAQEPDRLFETIAASTRQLCEDTAGRLRSLAPQPTGQYVWTLAGEVAVHAKVEELIEAAESEIWLKADTATARRHADSLRRAAVERGVHLMVILFGTEAGEFRFTDSCRIFVHEASGVRMGTADNLFTIAVDQIEMLTANEEPAGVAAAVTQNRSLVKMALSLIRHDYYMAEIFARFKDRIDAAFGPHLHSLRLDVYTAEQVDSFRQKTGSN
jgi:sugar-specific transcriptional regulator TrmB